MQLNLANKLTKKTIFTSFILVLFFALISAVLMSGANLVALAETQTLTVKSVSFYGDSNFEDNTTTPMSIKFTGENLIDLAGSATFENTETASQVALTHDDYELKFLDEDQVTELEEVRFAGTYNYSITLKNASYTFAEGANTYYGTIEIVKNIASNQNDLYYVDIDYSYGYDNSLATYDYPFTGYEISPSYTYYDSDGNAAELSNQSINILYYKKNTTIGEENLPIECGNYRIEITSALFHKTYEKEFNITTNYLGGVTSSKIYIGYGDFLTKSLTSVYPMENIPFCYDEHGNLDEKKLYGGENKFRQSYIGLPYSNVYLFFKGEDDKITPINPDQYSFAFKRKTDSMYQSDFVPIGGAGDIYFKLRFDTTNAQNLDFGTADDSKSTDEVDFTIGEFEDIYYKVEFLFPNESHTFAYTGEVQAPSIRFLNKNGIAVNLSSIPYTISYTKENESDSIIPVYATTSSMGYRMIVSSNHIYGGSITSPVYYISESTDAKSISVETRYELAADTSFAYTGLGLDLKARGALVFRDSLSAPVTVSADEYEITAYYERQGGITNPLDGKPVYCGIYYAEITFVSGEREGVVRYTNDFNISLAASADEKIIYAALVGDTERNEIPDYFYTASAVTPSIKFNLYDKRSLSLQTEDYIIYYYDSDKTLLSYIPSAVGKYYAKISIINNPSNYLIPQDGEALYEFNITERTLTISGLQVKDMEYTGSDDASSIVSYNTDSNGLAVLNGKLYVMDGSNKVYDDVELDYIVAKFDGINVSDTAYNITIDFVLKGEKKDFYRIETVTKQAKIIAKKLYIKGQDYRTTYSTQRDTNMNIYDVLFTDSSMTNKFVKNDKIDIKGDIGREVGNNVGKYIINYDDLYLSGAAYDNYVIVYPTTTNYYYIDKSVISIDILPIVKTYGEQDAYEDAENKLIKVQLQSTIYNTGRGDTIESISFYREDGEDVGKYRIHVKDVIINDINGNLALKDGENYINYDVQLSESYLEIVKKDLTITVKPNMSSYYGDPLIIDNPTNSYYSHSGIITGESISVRFYLISNIAQSYQVQCDYNGSDVSIGVYDVETSTFTTDTKNNYNIIFDNTNQYVIKPRNLELKISNYDSLTKVYGEDDTPINYTLIEREEEGYGLCEGHVAQFTIKRASGESVNNYAIPTTNLKGSIKNADGLNVSQNYKVYFDNTNPVTGNPCVYSITKRPIKIYATISPEFKNMNNEQAYINYQNSCLIRFTFEDNFAFSDDELTFKQENLPKAKFPSFLLLGETVNGAKNKVNFELTSEKIPHQNYELIMTEANLTVIYAANTLVDLTPQQPNVSQERFLYKGKIYNSLIMYNVATLDPSATQPTRDLEIRLPLTEEYINNNVVVYHVIDGKMVPVEVTRDGAELVFTHMATSDKPMTGTYLICEDSGMMKNIIIAVGIVIVVAIIIVLVLWMMHSRKKSMKELSEDEIMGSLDEQLQSDFLEANTGITPDENASSDDEFISLDNIGDKEASMDDAKSTDEGENKADKDTEVEPTTTDFIDSPDTLLDSPIDFGNANNLNFNDEVKEVSPTNNDSENEIGDLSDIDDSTSVTPATSDLDDMPMIDFSDDSTIATVNENPTINDNATELDDLLGDIDFSETPSADKELGALTGAIIASNVFNKDVDDDEPLEKSVKISKLEGTEADVFFLNKKHVVEGENIVLPYTFENKLLLSSDNLKLIYNDIKNTLLSYEGVMTSIESDFETFRTDGNTLARISVNDNAICLMLNLDSKDLEGTEYKIFDMSTETELSDAPSMILINGVKTTNKAHELIKIMMEANKCNLITDYKNENFLNNYPIIKNATLYIKK